MNYEENSWTKLWHDIHICSPSPEPVPIPARNSLWHIGGWDGIAMFNPEASLVVSVANQNIESSCGLSVTKDRLLAVAACYQHTAKTFRYKYNYFLSEIAIILVKMSGVTQKARWSKMSRPQERKGYKPPAFLNLMAVKKDDNAWVYYSAFGQSITILQNGSFTGFPPMCQIIPQSRWQRCATSLLAAHWGFSLNCFPFALSCCLVLAKTVTRWSIYPMLKMLS